jgi:hypothetical protein
VLLIRVVWDRPCDLLLLLGDALLPTGDYRRVVDDVAPVAFNLAEAAAPKHGGSNSGRWTKRARVETPTLSPGPSAPFWRTAWPCTSSLSVSD